MSERGYIVAVIVLGLCGFAATVGVVVVAVIGRDVPAALSAIVGLCLGAVGGLLTQPQRPATVVMHAQEVRAAPADN